MPTMSVRQRPVGQALTSPVHAENLMPPLQKLRDCFQMLFDELGETRKQQGTRDRRGGDKPGMTDPRAIAHGREGRVTAKTFNRGEIVRAHESNTTPASAVQLSMTASSQVKGRLVARSKFGSAIFTKPSAPSAILT